MVRSGLQFFHAGLRRVVSVKKKKKKKKKKEKKKKTPVSLELTHTPWAAIFCLLRLVEMEMMDYGGCPAGHDSWRVLGLNPVSHHLCTCHLLAGIRPASSLFEGEKSVTR